MKILIVGRSTANGGAEKRMLSFANYASNYHKIFLVTFVPHPNDQFVNDTTTFNQINHIVLHNDISISGILDLYKIIKDIDPDKIYGFLGHVNIMLGILRPFFSKTRFIFRENATYSIFFREKGFFGSIQKQIYKKYLKKADVIVAQSNFMKKEQVEILKIDKSKIVVLNNPYPNFLDETKDEFVFDGNLKYLLSVGRLEKVKNQKDIIDSLTYLDEDYHLIIVGEGSLKDKLYEHSIDIGVENRVHFVGPKTNLKYYYKNSNLLLLTSERETSPNVLIEANQSNLYVVSYDIPGGIKDMIDEGINGTIIKENSPMELSKQIKLNIKKIVPDEFSKFMSEDSYNKILMEI